MKVLGLLVEVLMKRSMVNVQRGLKPVSKDKQSQSKSTHRCRTAMRQTMTLNHTHTGGSHDPTCNSTLCHMNIITKQVGFGHWSTTNSNKFLGRIFPLY